MQFPVGDHRFLSFFPPYRRFQVLNHPAQIPRGPLPIRGSALLWNLGQGGESSGIHAVRSRPPGVALILIPQSLAYAQLAGLPAYFGLYALFLPTIVAAYFGSSRIVSTGPVAIVAILTATTVSSLAQPGSSEYITYVVLLALTVGFVQLLLGSLKLGALSR